MARPNWEYIRIDVLLPEHPKIDLLSRSARWTLVELWCYCGRNRTDGIVSAQRWRTFGTAGERRQIIDAGFADPIEPGGGYLMHGYLDHQRSREQIEQLSKNRADAGRKGGKGGSKPEASASPDPPFLPKHLLAVCSLHAASRGRGKGSCRGKNPAAGARTVPSPVSC